MKMTFEDLEAWKKARQLVNDVYAMTRQTALSKDFGLCGQVQRAAISAMSNIAEGFERQHIPEKLQAYNIARASCGEVRSLLYVIEDIYQSALINPREMRDSVGMVGALITGLISSTRKRLVAKAGGTLALIVLFLWIGSYLLSPIS